MLDSMRYGLTVVSRRSLIVLVLFLYEMLWGFILYRYVKSVVVPLLYRYPGAEAPDWAMLYWIEGEFRLLKTDLADPYLLVILAILAGRMLLTPFINAGLYHAVHQVSIDQWRAFITGITNYWGRFSTLYVLQMLISWAPLAWIIPSFTGSLLSGTLGTAQLLDYGLLLLALLAYICLVRLAFMYIQFAVTAGESWFAAVVAWLRSLFPVLGLSLLILLLALVTQGLISAASMWQAGLTALILYQASPLLRIFFKMWEISSQHDLWTKTRK